MALTRQISRIAKLLVDAEGISFPEAEARLKAMTLEIVIGPWGHSPAGHAAVLTALAVGRRSFLGGVRVTGDLTLALRSPLSTASTIGGAVQEIGIAKFAEPPAARIIIGGEPMEGSVAAWWDGWKAGVRHDQIAVSSDSGNPLAGITAGAMAIGAAFQSMRGKHPYCADIDLWPTPGPVPAFGDVYLPSAIWLMGLGNLGQAFIWSLASLPFQTPSNFMLHLQDFDTVSEENWSTSILVEDDRFGELKTKMAEVWIERRGFAVRRVDRPLFDGLKLAGGEPRLCLSGFDKITPRRLLAEVGFEAIVDAGLGRTAHDFDKFRVNVFDAQHRIDDHFVGMVDSSPSPNVPDGVAYQMLEADIGRCGAAEIGHASIAVPYVSAVAGAIAVARAIAISSGLHYAASEAQRVLAIERRLPRIVRSSEARGIGHSGIPKLCASSNL